MFDYNYDANGVYTGKSQRQIDPLETKNAGETVYLVLPNTTTVEPPTIGDNQTAQWDGNAWALIDDYRHQEVYSTTDQSTMRITDVGPLPAGYTDLAPASDYDVWDGNAWVHDQDAEDLANANSFIAAEMYTTDIEINKHNDNHARTVATLAEWTTYRNELRDYVVDGVIVTAQPVRPT